MSSKHRDGHARIAVDKVQDAVMGAAEAEFGQNGIGFAHKVPVGKEQILDDLHGFGIIVLIAMRFGLERYVSHVDIFRQGCYTAASVGERKGPRDALAFSFLAFSAASLGNRV
jgi:hypothetical protein